MLGRKPGSRRKIWYRITEEGLGYVGVRGPYSILLPARCDRGTAGGDWVLASAVLPYTPQEGAIKARKVCWVVSAGAQTALGVQEEIIDIACSWRRGVGNSSWPYPLDC